MIPIIGGNPYHYGNYIQWSEDLSKRTFIQASNVAGSVETPVGTLSNATMKEAATTSVHYGYLSGLQADLVDGTTYVFSVFAKGALRSWIQPYVHNQANRNCWSSFDITNGTVGVNNDNITDAGIVVAADGFWRCDFEFTYVAVGAAESGVFLCTADSTWAPSYAGNAGSNAIYIAGWQIERKQYRPAGVYKKTVGAAVTRTVP